MDVRMCARVEGANVSKKFERTGEKTDDTNWDSLEQQVTGNFAKMRKMPLTRM
jgi:hypothetical protein